MMKNEDDEMKGKMEGTRLKYIYIIIDKASEWTKYLASIIFYYNEGGW